MIIYIYILNTAILMAMFHRFFQGSRRPPKAILLDHNELDEALAMYQDVFQKTWEMIGIYGPPQL